jgi:hypothetical protein
VSRRRRRRFRCDKKNETIAPTHAAMQNKQNALLISLCRGLDHFKRSNEQENHGEAREVF